ncbi:uncharacterized protein NPIL_580021 [Nephila pilipes]|uniref:Mutator-like transposase domain-containing protein n=1 Tax=Nephila pilipes TaxID=299642 RepID=A0A8X6PKN9_NEPPI|nr:uncharacterized protein NPIL_580021 [Nephila pilipes]
MRCIGKGAESAVMFSGIMNLPPPPTKFNNILLQAARETCEESMAEAVHEAVEENDGGRDIAVAVDGSWQKRGFSSKNGVVTVTSVDTGKVIDVEILSKHCICPNKIKHLQNCKRNFVGYSGKMERYSSKNQAKLEEFFCWGATNNWESSRQKMVHGIPNVRYRTDKQLAPSGSVAESKHRKFGVLVQKTLHNSLKDTHSLEERDIASILTWI